MRRIQSPRRNLSTGRQLFPNPVCPRSARHTPRVSKETVSGGFLTTSGSRHTIHSENSPEIEPHRIMQGFRSFRKPLLATLAILFAAIAIVYSGLWTFTAISRCRWSWASTVSTYPPSILGRAERGARQPGRTGWDETGRSHYPNQRHSAGRGFVDRVWLQHQAGRQR